MGNTVIVNAALELFGFHIPPNQVAGADFFVRKDGDDGKKPPLYTNVLLNAITAYSEEKGISVEDVKLGEVIAYMSEKDPTLVALNRAAEVQTGKPGKGPYAWQINARATLLQRQQCQLGDMCVSLSDKSLVAFLGDDIGPSAALGDEFGSQYGGLEPGNDQGMIMGGNVVDAFPFMVWNNLRARPDVNTGLPSLRQKADNIRRSLEFVRQLENLGFHVRLVGNPVIETGLTRGHFLSDVPEDMPEGIPQSQSTD